MADSQYYAIDRHDLFFLCFVVGRLESGDYCVLQVSWVNWIRENESKETIIKSARPMSNEAITSSNPFNSILSS